MAFDGIVIAGLVHELNQTILNTKISKIAQPENDELLLTCKGSSGQFRVSISANASLPFLYLTDTNKTSPLQAPTFCMVLRKHIANGRVISITQPHMERIIHLKIEHLNEMGDLCHKTLVIELMGKHSNIIFCDEDGNRQHQACLFRRKFPARSASGPPVFYSCHTGGQIQCHDYGCHTDLRCH